MTLTPEASKSVAQPPTQALTQEEAIASLGRYGYGWADSDVAGANAQRGLSEAVVRDISAKKNEPDWMLQSRLKALRIFDRKPIPKWAPTSMASISTTSSTSCAPPRSRPRAGMICQRTSATPTTGWESRRPRSRD